MASKGLKSFAVIGAAGKVGSATSSALRQAGHAVRAIVRDAAKASRLREIGCDVVEADLHNADALAEAMGTVDGVQIIIPLAVGATDGAAEMRRGIESLARALETAQPAKILLISDYGAHRREDIGMPTLFRSCEDRLRRVRGHKLFLRSAEHMQNWGGAVAGALESGTLMSFRDPTDARFATISAPDVGIIAADLLTRPPAASDIEIVHAEGPRRYSAHDVAAAVGQLAGRTIDVQPVPRSQWRDVFERNLSPSLAALLIQAGDAQNRGGIVDVEPDAGDVRYGTTELIDALRPIVSP